MKKYFNVFTKYADAHNDTSLIALQFVIENITKRAVPCQNVSSGMCGQRMPRSACAYAQSDQGLHCLLNALMESEGPDDILRMRRMI